MQPDGVYYALARLAECKSTIARLSEMMVTNRAGIEKHYDKNRARAADFHTQLQNEQRHIVECVRDSRLFLLEMNEPELAAYAGALAEQLAAFNLMTKNYAALAGVLADFAAKLPETNTTNAVVLGHWMNDVLMGYYPTDIGNIEHILRGLVFPPGVTTNLLDPCCGEGTALKKLAVGNNCFTYGVELDVSRATLAQEELHRVGFGSYFHSRISREAFHLLFLNPPYLTVMTEGGGRTRDEKRFLIDSYQHLMMGGLLVYIIPHYRLTEDICRVLADNFTDISVSRFTDGEFGKFKQIVVLGKRVRRIDGSEQVTALAESAYFPDKIPCITKLDAGRYVLPSLPKKVELFKGARFNEFELARQLKSSKSLDGLLTKAEDRNIIRRPPLPFSFSQLGLIGGSGLINGQIDCDTPHIIKGRIVKKMRTTSSDITNHIGDVISTEIKETISNKMIFNILTPGGFRSLA